MVRKATSPESAPLSSSQRALLTKLSGESVAFMDNPVFHRPQAARQLFDDALAVQAPNTAWYQPLLDDRRRSDDPSLARVPRTAVLTAAQERVLFSQFNYARYMLSRLQRAGKRGPLPVTKQREMLHWHETSDSLRHQIAETNLALVLAMAKRVRSADLDFGDLMSEGNMALMRAIDKFDVTRGFKFSTYACRAILKAYSRLGQKTQKYRQHFPVEFDQELERGDHVAEVRALREQESITDVKELFAGNRAALSAMEKTVIFHRFGLDRPVKESPMTLEQIGTLVGVTKERVRQIQAKALEKIRHALVEMDRDTSRKRSTIAALRN